MAYIEFKEEEKAKAFDRICERFYEKNFGQTSKSEIELLMFDIYLEKLIEGAKNEDNSLDYTICSDYRISRDLGITQQRVRNLKVKKQLAYPIDFEWQLSLASLTQNARYDQSSHKITIGIPDPNLYIEIQNFIEEHGGFIEKQLNSKLLTIRAEYYIDLVTHLEEEDQRKQIIKRIKKELKNSGKDDTKFDEKHIGKSLLEIGANVTTLAVNITDLISPVNVIGTSLMQLLTSVG